jgi:hypothetical protein
VQHAGRRLELLLGVVALCCIASSPLRAQVPAPTSAPPPPPFDNTIVLGGSWLQANSLPLTRQGTVVQSFSGDISWRPGSWAFAAGFLRIARNLSTVQGGTLSAGWVFKAGPVGFVPTLSAFGGASYASFDSTGYDFVNGTTIGHQARYSYSTGAAFGGGVGLAIEAPIYSIIGARIVGSEWVFSGSPLADNRWRTVLGAGLTIRVR